MRRFSLVLLAVSAGLCAPAAGQTSTPAAAVRGVLTFADFPSRFADGNCLQGLAPPVIVGGEARPGFCKSDKPLLFDMHRSPMPTKLLLDESAGPGKGYDTLYVDFDDDGDFTNDPVYRASSFHGTMFPGAAPVVLYFRNVHLPRNRKEGTSTHVQICIEELPGWPETITALHPRIIPQRWAVGSVMVGTRKVPAAVIDRNWDETFVDRRGLDIRSPGAFPRGDYLVLGLDGESRLEPCDLDEYKGSARFVMTEYLAIDGQIYQVEATRSGDGVFVELTRVDLPKGTLSLDAKPAADRLLFVGTRTCAIVRRPGREVRLPIDTYVAPQIGGGLLMVKPEQGVPGDLRAPSATQPTSSIGTATPQNSAGG